MFCLIWLEIPPCVVSFIDAVFEGVQVVGYLWTYVSELSNERCGEPGF
jgi:hypothetical protein